VNLDGYQLIRFAMNVAIWNCLKFQRVITNCLQMQSLQKYDFGKYSKIGTAPACSIVQDRLKTRFCRI